MLLGPLRKVSQFYPLKWSSRKSKRPVWSIGSVEILYIAEAVDEVKMLKSVTRNILGVQVEGPFVITKTDRKVVTVA